MKNFVWMLVTILVVGVTYSNQSALANPFFSNGYFTENGIEWCQENLPLYEILGDKFFEHHKHSLESRVCASLYQDYYWTYEGPDRVEKLIERSKHYSQLEISESLEESETGIIDTTPAENKDQTLLQGITADGETMVQIISSSPKFNQAMEINLSFLNKDSSLLANVNYGIEITQDGQQILKNDQIYSEKGLSTLITRPLKSEEPVKIIISVNGIGDSQNPNEWTGSRGEVLMFTVVPEFGAVTLAILASTITIGTIFGRNKMISFRS